MNKKYLFIIVCLLSFVNVSSAATPDVTLSGSYSIKSRKLTLQMSPKTSALGCHYEIFSSGNRTKLQSSASRGTLVLELKGKSSRSLHTVKSLASVYEKSKKSKDIFFRARVSCGDDRAQTNTLRLAVRASKSSSNKRIAAWLDTLRDSFIGTTLSTVEAFPNLSFNHPIDLQNAGDGTNRLFVVEQGGKIQVFNNSASTSSSSEFLDISSRLISGGERGLLGLAFHPDFPTTPYFYVNYTRSGNGATVISRFQVDANNANQGDASSELILLTISQPYANHNGGQVAFGPDGYLYIGMGDGGSANDPQGNGQDKTKLLGKMLRIDVDHPASGQDYGIPADNPFVGNTSGYKEEIYAIGLRNPWRFSWDLETQRLYAGDVGQGSYEEVDIIEKGKNYGWNTMEGKHCFNPSSGCDTSGLTLPITEYSHSVGDSITGGYVYRGNSIPNLYGVYLYGDYVEGKLWGLRYDGTSAHVIDIQDVDYYVSAFGRDEAGEVYVLSYLEGKIYKFKR